MTTTEQKLAIRKILDSKHPEDLFGPVKEEELPAAYKDLARHAHPDRGGTIDAFVRLGKLFEKAREAFRLGIYGSKREPPKAAASTAIKVGKKTYRVGAVAFSGDAADFYECEPEPATHFPCLLKVARSPKSNDLLRAEERAIRKLRPEGGTGTYRRYLPNLADSFDLKGKTTRRAHVFRRYSDAFVPVSKVADRYPHGLDFRDAAWMLKRVLEALGFVASSGFAHGAILPEHVLVHPVNHGAKIVGWGQSVALGKPIVAVSPARRLNYPPEVFKKIPATPALDVFMAFRMIEDLIRGDRLRAEMPGSVERVFRAALLESPSRRLGDAWEAHRDLEDALRTAIGPPAYRELRL